MQHAVCVYLRAFLSVCVCVFVCVNGWQTHPVTKPLPAPACIHHSFKHIFISMKQHSHTHGSEKVGNVQ